MGNSALFAWKEEMKKVLILILAASILTAGWYYFDYRRPGFEAHIIDVGEGEAILLRTKEGTNALIDAGGLPGAWHLVDYLKKNGVKKIDHLILTHPDPDHISGVFFLIPEFKVGNVYDNGEDISGIATSQDLYRWYTALVRAHPRYQVLKRGDTLTMGSVVLRIVWPPQPLPQRGFNDNSLVIMAARGPQRMLLTGDLSNQGQQEVLKGGNVRAQILKVAHHGAVDATSAEFLKEVAPHIAVISVNKNNLRGYPSEEVVQRLQKYNVRVYRTDRDGNIIFTFRRHSQLNPQVKSTGK